MAEPRSSSKRLRTRRACIPCSSRKRKCNGAYPCDTCNGYGYLCSYRQSRQEQYARQANRAKSSLEAKASMTDLIQGCRQSNSNTGNNNVTFVEPPARYIGRHSLEAFPRYLGLQLQSDILPQMQPYVWNLHAREQSPCRVGDTICSMVTLARAKNYLQSFFAAKFPICGCMDFESLIDRTENHFMGNSQGLSFEALVGGIIGMSSILTISSNSQSESQIVRHAEAILSDQATLSEPNVDLLAALFLRALYLRATATPHITWFASCTTMHMAESLGLHKEIGFDQHSGMWNAESCSYLFWVVCAGNRLISHEMGRTPVILLGVTRQFPFAPTDKSNAAMLAHLGCKLPLTDGTVGSESDLNHLTDLLDAARTDTTGEHPYLTLLKADVCFCLYRRIRVNSELNLISRSQTQQIVSIGKAAVQAATVLAQKGQAWWNMLNTLFQWCCVLISLDSIDALSDLHFTLQTINLIKDRYPSKTIREALLVLQLLIRAMKQKKEKEVTYLTILEYLEPAVPSVPVTMADLTTSQSSTDFTFDLRAWGPEDLDWVLSEAPLVH
ncbi:hypothetical protein BGW36DRAFT_334627 [Talaromyces proteolyticus]|uniref:Zn(2)-C6 fungal-type domain-containing protein n=1 Tax=Talaromyces proteolyticus TaxID=1131652 RepID=A0AAD4Q049_9EURO|nr:uncharacterized protein BGW36DRAFT_334627 [Talaromyces proteolyticus]KAH8703713.1 hypothetical protein BGW36DRAFT_334627 [Talaromyces proteolyticus]